MKSCLLLVALLLGVVSFELQAQNLIANPGFENNPPPANGNNLGWSFSPWILGPGDQSNVVKVDGPGGYNYGNAGPQSDASNNGAGAGAGVAQHYADIVGTNDFYQVFTVPVCGGAPGQMRTATFSGWFSTRDNLSGSGVIRIRAGAGISGTILGQQSVTLSAPAQGSGLAPWTRVSGTVNVQSGAQVSFVVTMTNNVNFDEAFLQFNDVTCVSAPLTLRKTWANAIVNDRAVLTATRNGALVDSLTSIADSANETDVDTTPLTVFQGETIVLAETLPGTNVGVYGASLACTGGGTLSGNTLTVNSTGTPIACTYTNSGAAADLRVTKTNTPGTNNDIDPPGDALLSGSAVSYTIRVTNGGPAAAGGSVVRDPPPTGLTCATANCTNPQGGAVCPAVSIAALQSATGVVISTMPANSSLDFVIGCTVQ